MCVADELRERIERRQHGDLFIFGPGGPIITIPGDDLTDRALLEVLGGKCGDNTKSRNQCPICKGEGAMWHDYDDGYGTKIRDREVCKRCDGTGEWRPGETG